MSWIPIRYSRENGGNKSKTVSSFLVFPQVQRCQRPNVYFITVCNQTMDYKVSRQSAPSLDCLYLIMKATFYGVQCQLLAP